MGELISAILTYLDKQGGLLAVSIAACLILFAFLRSGHLRTVIRDGGEQRDRLVARIIEGGDFRELYVSTLDGVLNRFDGIIGDRELVRRGKAHPDWNGRLFDVCAALAIAYPFFSLMLTWIFFGSAGPVGAAIGLTADLVPRAGMLVASALMALAFYFFATNRFYLGFLVFLPNFSSFLFALFAQRTGAIDPSVVGSLLILAPFAFWGAGAAAIAFSGSRAGVCASVVASTVPGSFALASVSGGARFELAAVAFAVAAILVVPATLLFSSRVAERRTMLGVFWCALFPVVLAISAIAPNQLAKVGASPPTQAGLPFIGIIALVNLPFDWASIGLTRWLLRRGLEPGRAHPIVYAALDLALAVVILAGLGVATILALHVVNIGQEIGGGEPMLPIDAIIADLRRDPADPAHLWIYFTLFSTLLPSLLNLMIATIALVSVGFPFKGWLSGRVAAYAANPSGETAVPGYAAVMLTTVEVLGILLALAAFYFGFLAIITIPGFGPFLLDAADWTANATEPAVRAAAMWVDRRIPG